MAQRAELKLDIGKILKAQKAGAVKGLEKGSEHLRGVSSDLAPHEEGTLANTATASVDEANLRAAVSFDMPYAVIQHERLDFKHDEGRQAKYLEEPMMTERDKIGEIVAAEIRRSLR